MLKCSSVLVFLSLFLSSKKPRWKRKGKFTERNFQKTMPNLSFGTVMLTKGPVAKKISKSKLLMRYKCKNDILYFLCYLKGEKLSKLQAMMNRRNLSKRIKCQQQILSQKQILDCFIQFLYNFPKCGFWSANCCCCCCCSQSSVERRIFKSESIISEERE